MNKEIIIQKLIESQVDYITRHGCGIWLHDILERGFAGFGNMSDEQLMREMRQRGIEIERDDKPWPVDEEDDEPEPDDEDLRRLIGECVTDDAV
jgi:hypothetical protein